MIGDLMLTFGGEAEICPTRTGKPWTLVADIGKACLYLTQSDEQWNGFPLTEVEDATWHCLLLGELYEDASPLPQMFAQPEKLNGHFLLVGFEKNLKRVHVITDRLGTVHVYHGRNGVKAAMGTFSPAVARSAKCSDLDRQALAEFFTFGFFLGDSTYWQGLHLLPAASHTILDENGQVLSQSNYWNWHYEPSDRLRYDDAIDQFHELFGKILRGQVRQKRVALPLSGGLDSRSTLAVLGNADIGGAAQLFPYSYGYTEDSAETRIARELGNKRGMAVRTWTIRPYLFDQIDRITASLEGFQDITQCRQAYVVDELSQQAEFVMAAHWGDVWLDDMGFLGQELLPDDKLPETLIKKYSKNGSEMLQTLFATNLASDWKEVMKEKVQKSVVRLGEICELDFKVKAWKTSQWSHRWTLSSLRMFQAGLFPLLPFYDNRLVDFFLQVPSQFVAGRIMQVDYLKRYAPDLAKVKWQPYNANLYHYKGFNTWLLPRRAMQKLVRKLFLRPIIQRNWEVQFLDPQGHAGLVKYFREPGLKLHKLFTVRDLRQLLTDFYQEPTARNGYAVSMLLTFSAWSELYG